MQADPLQSVLVVGGGTAGWMTAAYLRRRTRLPVTLVESSTIGTIGVGEATIPALRDFVLAMEIDEDELMRRCQATYKLAIRFEGWTREGFDYWHPFGLCGAHIDGIDLFHHWRNLVVAGRCMLPYAAYSLQGLLAERARAHRPIGGDPVVPNYAFHLNAQALADYLREIATGDGVVHRVEDVTRVELDEKGRVECVHTSSGQRLGADLYVDCTGFRGVLIEEAMSDPWEDWSDTLLCDRALVLRLPSDPRMRPFTRATAHRAGWIWQIPLVSRVGTGYVFSSRHESDEAAARELLGSAGADPSLEQGLQTLRMRVGRRRTFWKSNCVAIGLSAGFIEPLESTGIFLIQRGLEELVECLPDRSFSPRLARLYGERMAHVYQEVRDFVLLHYLLSGRDDLPFWRDSRHVQVPSSLADLLSLYDETGHVLEAERDPVFRDANFLFILAGGERYPRRVHPRAALLDGQRVAPLLEHIRGKNEELAEALPTHAELMAWLHAPREAVGQGDPAG